MNFFLMKNFGIKRSYKQLIRNKRKKLKSKIVKENPLLFLKENGINLYSRILIIIILCIFLFHKKYLDISENNDAKINDDYIISLNKTIEKDTKEEIKDIQIFLEQVMNGTELYKNKKYYFSNNPKISIVISVYNGEAYLKTILLSIQNQDLKDIEIVMIDDGSKDNSVNLIKELMKTEPRIVLYQNKENKGALYTKSTGVLLSRGKYVMTMDEDDIYVQNDAFSTLLYFYTNNIIIKK